MTFLTCTCFFDMFWMFCLFQCLSKVDSALEKFKSWQCVGEIQKLTVRWRNSKVDIAMEKFKSWQCVGEMFQTKGLCCKGYSHVDIQCDVDLRHPGNIVKSTDIFIYFIYSFSLFQGREEGPWKGSFEAGKVEIWGSPKGALKAKIRYFLFSKMSCWNSHIYILSLSPCVDLKLIKKIKIFFLNQWPQSPIYLKIITMFTSIWSQK